MVVKEVDEQGRIIIPKEWRDRHLKGRKVILKMRDESLEIVPCELTDLTKYFDKMQVDVKSNLSDWHALQKELRKR